MAGRAFSKPGNDKVSINAARHFKRVLLEVFEFYLDEIAFGYEVLVFLITIVEIGIYLDDVVYDFVVGNILQLQRLYGVCKEVARRFKYRVGIAHEVDELGIGEHFEQNLDASRVGRVFGEETFAVGIPKRYFDKSLECLLELVDFPLGCFFKQQVFLAVLGYSGDRTRSCRRCRVSCLPEQTPLPAADRL